MGGSRWRVLAVANGVTDVVPRGPSLSLRFLHQKLGGPWVTDTVAGANSTYSEASIIVRTNGQTDVVAQGPYSSPAMFVRANDEIDVVVQGPNNSLRYLHASPGGPWSSTTIAPPGTTYE